MSAAVPLALYSCGVAVLLGVSGWRAATFNADEWRLLREIRAHPAPPGAPAGRTRLPAPARPAPEDVEWEGDDDPWEAEDEAAPAARPAPRRILAAPMKTDGTVPRPRQLMKALAWRQAGRLAPLGSERIRFLDPALWPPRPGAVHLMLAAPGSATGHVAVAVDTSGRRERLVTAELRFNTAAVDRIEFESTLTNKSGWIVLAGTDAVQEHYRLTGPKGVVVLWDGAMKFIPPAQAAAAAAWLKEQGVELHYDTQRKLWVGHDIDPARMLRLNFRLGTELRTRLKLTVWESEEWVAMRDGGKALVPLGSAGAPWGLALNTRLPGHWRVDSLWAGHTAVGFRLRYLPD